MDTPFQTPITAALTADTISVLHTTTLTPEQKEAVRQLTKACHAHDSTSLSYPLDEDGCHHYLLYANTSSENASAARDASAACPAPLLCAVLAILPMEEEAECSAFTLPSLRRRGYFSRLFRLALETFEEYDILLPVSGSCPDTLAALESIGAEPESVELQMELDLEPETEAELSEEFSNNINQTRVTGGNDGISCVLRPDCNGGSTDSNASADGEISSDTLWNLFACRPDTKNTETLLGSCETAQITNTCVCLHHVEILPEFRSQGYGSELLRLLLSALCRHGIRRVILQVSGGNEAALALYKKQGFRITETLSYYLY